jgi:cell wall-associated NlpC family hydrolase
MKKLFKRNKHFESRIIRHYVNAVYSRLWKILVRTFARFSGQLRRRIVIARMRKADIILASPRTLRLSPINLMYRLVLRAQYVHSMLYIGDGKMIHTTTRHGVLVALVPRKIFSQDYYTILRTKHLRAEQRDQVVREALKLRGKRLDYAGLISNIPTKVLGLRKPLLRLEENRLWCAKLIYTAYAAAGIELVLPDKSENVTSEDLSHSFLLKRISQARVPLKM